MKDIIKKLEELKNELLELKKMNHATGTPRYYSITQLTERIIDRIYPEKDSKTMKRKLFIVVGFAGRNEIEKQKDYVDDIDRNIRVIDTILEEFKLFGFDDFKSLKEKTET